MEFIRDVNICLEQFEKFYNLLMKEVPEGYIPWFFPCEKNGKNPSPIAILNINPNSKGSWHHESARLSKEQCIEHIKLGYNIGISARKGDPLILIDIDNLEYLNQTTDNTLVINSRKRQGTHAFCWDKDGSAKINLPTDEGEIRSDNQYVLACGSYVPFNLDKEKDRKVFEEELLEETKNDPLLGYYTVKEEKIPRFISFDELPKFFKDKEKQNIALESSIKQREEKESYSKIGKYTDLFKLKISDITGPVNSGERVGHPLHESDTGANFSLNQDGSLGYCWRHMVSLNAVQYLCVKAGYAKCEDAGTPMKGRGISKIRGDKKAFKIAYEEALKLNLIEEKHDENLASKIFTVQGQVENFYINNPFFFDKSGMFWIWNIKKFKYEISDEIDILNGISVLGIDTISNKTKGEILNALKQYGRMNIPEPAEFTWVQFKDTIYDYKNDTYFKASPKYFITNPIPWELGDSSETPIMTQLFKEWVGEKYVKTLEQIIAYCCSSNQFMQRLIALVGGGSNGKGTFIKLLIQFLGQENITSSELKELSSNQFETSSIYKKLLCVMGEICHDDLKNTNQIKKLSGEDQIRFCYKGKTPFSEQSITTIISATNSLPNTPDKTTGFYRKWLIIDFPNQFKINNKILNKIPENEFNNLAKKSIIILKKLYESEKFKNEGDYEERRLKYEARSNPVIRFAEKFCKEIPNEKAELKHFSTKFNEYAHENHLRIMSVKQIGKILREEGYEIGNRTYQSTDGTVSSKVFIINVLFSM